MVTAAALIGQFRGAAEGLETGEVEFSGPTYQVQVLDEGDHWPLIQFDEGGEVRDALCACSEEESCVHIAAALLRILGQSNTPLHLRFDVSLWNALCQLFGERQGYETDILTKIEGGYQLVSPSHKILFRLETSDTRWIEERPKETEENSLKFSGLSGDDLALWREGRPSPALAYELSFWSDLAKELLLRQDCGEEYSISLSGEGLPSGISIGFPDLHLFFYISEANLPAIIPALSTVESPLQVHFLEDEAIDSITYNREERTLEVHAHGKAGKRPEGIAVDGWTFVPGDGFYSEERHTLLDGTIEDVDGALNEHTAVIARYLKGEKVHTEAIAPTYRLHFDEEGALHIHAHLLAPGDLTEESSCLFGCWAYLHDDGFHPIQDPQFPDAHTLVAPEKVSEFIHTHRFWLNHQNGFATHLTPIEAQLTYQVDEGGNLHFLGAVDLPEGHDCGDWVYLPGQGFYAKTSNRTPIRPGRMLPAAQVALFIQSQREELDLVEGFFSQRQPVLRASLSLALSEKELQITPSYELYPEYRDQKLHFYDTFVYIQGLGFCEIPHELRLPARFAEPLTLKEQELDLFLAYELETVRPLIGELDTRLQKPATLRIEAIESEERIKLRYHSPLGQVGAAEVWRALESGQRYLFSDAGLLDLTDRRFHPLRQIPAKRVGKELLRLTTVELMRLAAVETLDTAGAPKLEALLKQEATSRPDTTGLTSTLRSYQETGLHWLWFLQSHGLSGLLCDDMGLGKTHQAMALIAAMQNREKRKYLVVCPTSVLYHWQEKLAQFLPGLRVVTYYGPGRSHAPLAKADLLLTSYGTLRAEKKPLAGVSFGLAIYDEVQMAKNPSSRTHIALAGVKSQMRLGLTGTPIENNLRELKALFDLIVPTYMPSNTAFQNLFLTPIEKQGDPKARELLRKVIDPFILRRKKEQVLTELPEKVEEISHCDLTDEQRSLYNTLLQRQRDQVMSELDASVPGAYLHIFTILTHLKQICDHPAAYLKTPHNYRHHESGKWQLFVQLLSQALESGQKVVVFSQYLAMLDIIELHLQDQGVEYAAIRGETRNRDRQLRRFQEDPECKVFVGSLQASGLGIDLTAGSIVIHYDRWWNAARENQATDRVHRIGQTRGVQVFKLVTLGTLEERINALIEEKGQLMEEVVGSSEQAQLKTFSREELAELLALLD